MEVPITSLSKAPRAGLWASLALAVLAPLSLAHSQTNTCGLETIIKDCAQLAKEPVNLYGSKALGIPEIKDGTFAINTVALFKNTDPVGAKEAAAASEPAKERALRLADSVRSSAIELLLGDVAKESWTPEQKSIHDRLKSLEFNFLSGDHARCTLEGTALGFPNAEFDPETNKLSLCPAAYKSHPAALTRALAHEIGHVISPCALSNSVYEVAPEAKSSSGPSMQECFEGDRENDVTAIAASLGQYLRGPLSPTGERLKMCGFLKSVPSMRPAQPVVFAGISKCLNQTYSPQWKSRISAFTKYFKKEEPLRQESDIRSDLESKLTLACHQISDEHFSDAFSAKLLGHIAAQKRWDKDTVRIALLDAAGNMCLEKLSGKEKFDSTLYPTTSTRLQIALNDPNIQNALGCQPPAPANLCSLKDFSPYTGQSSGTSSGTTTKSPKSNSTKGAK